MSDAESLYVISDIGNWKDLAKKIVQLALTKKDKIIKDQIRKFDLVTNENGNKTTKGK